LPTSPEKTLRNIAKNKVVHKFQSTLLSSKKVGGSEKSHTLLSSKKVGGSEKSRLGGSEKNRLCCVAK